MAFVWGHNVWGRKALRVYEASGKIEVLKLLQARESALRNWDVKMSLASCF